MLPWILAQQSVAGVFLWSLLLIGLLIAGFVFTLIVRRRATGAGPAQSSTFSLSDLRKMRDSGQITPEQYEKLKETVIGGIKTPDRMV